MQWVKRSSDAGHENDTRREHKYDIRQRIRRRQLQVVVSDSLISVLHGSVSRVVAS